MTPVPYDRIKRVVLEARDRPAAERGAFVAAACAGDAALQREVMALLQRDAGTEWFLGRAVPADPASGGALGHIGPYRLIRVLGEGGMGRVYLAEQERPIRREVAIKRIRRGLDTDRIVARFESERQALALMDHPGIARVYDAGADADGQPYFVMERVHGEPITLYCERERTPTRARLELFLAVCAAIQHAHQRGVIHRDLKPSNILVAGLDGRPSPKVIDFGIAKAIATVPGAETLTALGQVMGTPDYMSPEQAGLVAGTIDTRADVYSLGVLLCELLTGQRPHRFDDVAPADVARRIAESEPRRPSALVAAGDPAAAHAQRTTPTQLRRQLVGDLDMIVLHALRKEPDRRYASVESLAKDIERHLAGLPISARPDTWTYRGTTFVRRHRAAVLAAGAALLAFLVLGVTYTVRLRAERDEATAARDEAEAVTGFLAGMLEAPDPSIAGRDVTVRSVLEQAAPRVAREMATRPRVAAQLDDAIGRAYAGLGELGPALHHLRRSLGAREALLGRDAPATIDVRGALAAALSDSGAFAPAESLVRENMRALRRTGREATLDGLVEQRELAFLLQSQGRIAAAESLFRAALAGYDRIAPADTMPRTHAAMLFANLLAEESRFGEAESLYALALPRYRREYGDEHPRTISALNALGLVHMSTGRHAAAESLLARAVALRRRVQGRDHPETVSNVYNLAVCQAQLGRVAHAESLFLDVLAAHARTYGADGLPTLIVQHRLGWLYATTGRMREAERTLRATLAARRRVLGPEHVSTLGTQVWFAHVLGAQGRIAHARVLFDRALSVQRRVLGAEHGNTLNTAYMYAGMELAAGRPDRAEPLLATATTGVAAAFGEEHPDWVRYATRWGTCLTALAQYPRADSILQRAWRRWATVAPTADASPSATALALAALESARRHPAEAARWRVRAARSANGPRPTPTAAR